MTSAEIHDLWENAPCGHLVTSRDGRIICANSTMVGWLGYDREALHSMSIADLLTAGGRIHYATHFGPILQMSGDLSGITIDLVTADGTRLPMFLTANTKRGAEGGIDRVRITAVDAADRRAYERELIEQRRLAENERNRVRAFAETLRRSLLPPILSPPPGLDAADYYYAASVDDIGGDFYDLFPLSSAKWGFFIGDVSGKGVDAAVVTGLTRYVLRSAAVSNDDPVQVLHNLNSVLRQEITDGLNQLCTVIYGNLTSHQGGFDVQLASGGHLPPLLLDASGGALYADTIGGQALGITADPHFISSRLSLGPGDTMVLYTDGLTEARTGTGHERFDDHGALLQFAKAHAPATAEDIVDSIHDLLDQLGGRVQDDAAVLAFGVPVA